METILLEKKDQIGTLTLNRPEKLNALSSGLLSEFSETIGQIATDSDIKVVVIRGAGRAFSTGYDLSGVNVGDSSKQRTRPFMVDDDRALLQRMVERWLRLRDLPKPVIAMVHG